MPSDYGPAADYLEERGLFPEAVALLRKASEGRINEARITFMGQPAKVNCDRNCAKAWGTNNRPKVQLSDNEDDYAYLADGELGEAPVDPGTYEGSDAKPESPDEFPNRWCVRECERCNMSSPDEYMLPLEVLSFAERRYNMPHKHKDRGHA